MPMSKVLLVLLITTFRSLPAKGINVTAPALTSSSSEIKVELLQTHEVSTKMQLDALTVAKQVQNQQNVCEALSDYFQENYKDYSWHAVQYDTDFHLRPFKLISLRINNLKNYVLFATKV